MPTKTFHDAETGVSFRYPVVWTANGSGNPSYLPSALSGTPGVRSVLTVNFSPEGNLYSKTNLSGLSFSFAVSNASTAAACTKLASDNAEAATPAKQVKTAGAGPFTEVSGSDAGMSHQLAFTLDVLFHHNTCLILERDFATLSPGVKPGTRALTDAETTALQRHLNDIFKSVTVR